MSPQPRDCPICREKIWPRLGLKNSQRVWAEHDEHVRAKHPGYWSWNRRTSSYYLIPLFLLLGSIPVALLFQQSVPLVLPTVILFSWLSALLVGVAVLSVKERGKQRFRTIWLVEHRYPVP